MRLLLLASLCLAAGKVGFAQAPGLRIRTVELPPAIVGESYEARIETNTSGRCTVPDIHLSTAAEDSLPPGLELTHAGLRGTPAQTGQFLITVHARSTCEATSRQYILLVGGRPILAVTPAELHFQISKADKTRPVKYIAVSADWDRFGFELISAKSSWLKLSAVSGTTPPHRSALSGTPVAITVDPANLEPGEYREVVTVTGWRSANQPSLSIVLTVTE